LIVFEDQVTSELLTLELRRVWRALGFSLNPALKRQLFMLMRECNPQLAYPKFTFWPGPTPIRLYIGKSTQKPLCWSVFVALSRVTGEQHEKYKHNSGSQPLPAL
jgi:hypothetical protein